MITLFRRMREKLIGDGNLRKYLVYAIGEILLVVIGILIALQVNNWNLERKQEQEAVQVLSDFKNSIEGYIAADFYLMPMIQLDTVHYHIFNKSFQPDLLDKSILINSETYILDPMSVPAASGMGWYYNENVNTILENERLFPERFSRILLIVRRLNAAFQTMGNVSAEMLEIQKENLKYMGMKDWMYETDASSFENRIEFYHTDTYFRNQLRRFNELNGRYTQQYGIWSKYSLFAWLEYQMTVNEKDFMELIEPLESWGYEQAKQVPCNDEIKEDPVHSFYFWHGVYNNTKEPLEIYFINPNTGERSIYNTIQPGEFVGRFTNNDFPYLQVGSNNTCERQYVTGWNNFIVINP